MQPKKGIKNFLLFQHLTEKEFHESQMSESLGIFQEFQKQARREQ